jgi:acyl-CoA synthetase (AMP-forming)/AMP-acid ligase II
MKFYENLNKFSDNIAFIEQDGTSYCYRDLIDESEKFSVHFKNNQKNLIFILAQNNIESVIAYLSTLISNHSALLIDSKIDQELLQNLKQVYKPDFLWTASQSSSQPVYKFKNYELINYDVHRDVQINPNLNLLLSTSGSTGSPKLVKLTADNLDANAKSIAEYLKLDSSERPITILPMHYSYGLSIYNSHLASGATILLTNDSIVTKTFWQFFKEQKATSISGVPFTYEMLRRLNFFNMNLDSLKTMTQAGGKLAPKYVLEFAEFSRKKNVDFYVMYGQTEATARIAYLPPEKNLDKCNSVGIAIPGGKLSIIDKSGSRITMPLKDGQLVYEGDNVMMGYAQQQEQLALGDQLNGRLETGDIAHFDRDGYFYITGRNKRFLKIYGNRVNLDEIEHYLKAKNFNCVCGGKDDALYIANTNPDDSEKIKKTVTEKYGFYHSVVNVIETNKILISSSGKVLYEKIFEEVLK